MTQNDDIRLILTVVALLIALVSYLQFRLAGSAKEMWLVTTVVSCLLFLLLAFGMS